MSATVIVPTRDRPTALARCLRSLSRLRHDDFEVVVVDDGGAEAVDSVVASFREDLRVQLARTPGAGPAAARNAGAALASGDLLAFTDDDCEPDPGWLAALEARVPAGGGIVAGGRTVNALERNRYSAASQAINDAVYEHYNGDPANAGFLASNNIAMRSADFAALGGFDERFSRAAGEDRDLCSRWLERGGRIAYEPEAVVRHSHDLGPLSFWRQHYGYGRGTYLQRRLRAERGGGFALSPSATSGILSAAARRAIAERRPSRLMLLGVWQLANAAGFLRAALGRS